MFCEFGPKWTVGLAKIALSLKIQTLGPGTAQYGKSIQGSNGLQIEIREILRARDNTRITKLHRISSPPSPTRPSTRGQIWVS